MPLKNQQTFSGDLQLTCNQIYARYLYNY